MSPEIGRAQDNVAAGDLDRRLFELVARIGQTWALSVGEQGRVQMGEALAVTKLGLDSVEDLIAPQVGGHG